MGAKIIGLPVALALAICTGANAWGFGPPPPGFSWTGFYVGGHLGYGDGEFNGIFDSGELPGFPEFVARGPLDVEGFLGGVQAGYNVQLGMWVLGVEGDISFLDESDKAFDPDPGPGPDTDQVRANLDTLGTLRVRGGPTFGRTFVFGTVGAAWADASWTA